MHRVARLQTASKTVAHKRRKVILLLGPLGPAATKKLPVQPGVSPGVTSHHGRVEIRNPFPNQTVQILYAEVIGRTFSNEGKHL